MKNLIVVGFVFLSTCCYAQTNVTDLRSRFMFGVKAGSNYSNVYDTKGESFQADGKFGLATGAFMAIPIGRFMGIQPEVLFSQKGFKGSGVILNDPYKITRTTSYIDVPLLFAVKPSEFLTVVAGPQISFLLKQRDVFANGVTSIAQEQLFESENFRKNILCFTTGLDLTLKHFVLSGRVGWDVQNNNGNGTVSTPRYKNVWLQTTVGYRFYKN